MRIKNMAIVNAHENRCGLIYEKRRTIVKNYILCIFRVFKSAEYNLKKNAPYYFMKNRLPFL